MATVYPRVCGGTRRARWLLVNGSGLSPRMRGNRDESPPRYGKRGLSPRMRGNPLPRPATPSGYRSIPAYAGEPRATRRRRPVCRVYPRVCGGTDDDKDLIVEIPGLSPRMRGNPPGSP